MNLDLAFAKRLLTDPKGVGAAQESGIRTDMLFDEGLKVVAHAMSFFTEHGKMPALETVEAETGVSLAGDVAEPIEYYIKEIVKRWKGNTVGAGLRQAVKALELGDPDQSLVTLIDTVSKVRKVGSAGNSLVDLTDERSIQKRIETYEKLKALGGELDGIPTPWESINRVTRGIHEDELWIILGKLKSGKTWAEIVLALHAWRTGWETGRKVLLVSEEMGIPKVARRWDAVNAQLPYGDFKRGQLATPVEERWHAALEKTKGKPSFWVAGRQRVKSVADLDMLIEETRPDITFVDGAYFLNNEQRSDSKWERSAGVADQLQALVQRRRHPVVATWQFNRKVKTGQAEGVAEDVAFAYEVMQDADVALGIFRPEDLERKKQAILRLVETRESEKLNPLLIEYDFDLMSFKEIGEVHGQEVATSPTKAEEIGY